MYDQLYNRENNPHTNVLLISKQALTLAVANNSVAIVGTVTIHDRPPLLFATPVLISRIS